MKTKGFTLIELIGVVSLIAILAIIVGASVRNTMDANKRKASTESLNKVIEIARQTKISVGYYDTIKLYNEGNNIKIIGYDELNSTNVGTSTTLDYNGTENIGNVDTILKSDGSILINYFSLDNYCFYQTEYDGEILIDDSSDRCE